MARPGRILRILSSVVASAAIAGCSAGSGTTVGDSFSGGPFVGFFENTALSYRPDTPHCDDPLVLNRIERRAPREILKVSHKHLEIVEFRHPVQTKFSPANFEIADIEKHVPKLGFVTKRDIVGKHQLSQRFCRVRAMFSDHHERTIYYVTETPMGFAGVGHNVTYCVSGLDPWRVHGGHCSSLRPH